MSKILLIEDDVELCQLLGELLSYEGFEITAVHDGNEGLKEALSGSYEMLLLDVMLPSLSGFDILQKLRETSQIPVIMLTARGEPEDRVKGLERGADDYLPKPFTDAELIARMKAVMRRTQVITTFDETLLSEGLSLCIPQQLVKYQDEEVELTSTELAILAELMSAAGSPVDKDHLSEKALGRKLMPFDRSIDMHVSHLRKKISSFIEPVPIKTIRGKGYIWTAATRKK